MRKKLFPGLLPALRLPLRAAPAVLFCYLVCALAGSALPVLSAWLTKLILDGMLTAGARDIVDLGIALGAVGLLSAAIPFVSQFLSDEQERKVGLLAQDKLFSAVDGFVGIGRYEDPDFLDRLRLAQQTAMNDPGSVVESFLGIVRSLTVIIGFLGTLWFLNPWMAGLVLLSGVPTMVSEIIMSRRRARMLRKITPSERREAVYRQLLTDVVAAKEIRLFGSGSFFRTRMLRQHRKVNKAKRAMDLKEMRLQLVMSLLTAAVSAGGLLWAVGAAGEGDISVGDIMIFVAAIAGVQGALSGIAFAVSRCHESLLMFDNYLSVVGAGPDLPVASPPAEMRPLSEGLELRDVWFRYSEEHPWVLRGVNLKIPSGQATALVGLNGAGKSTLVNLICRFYDPTEGAVLWDGTDIRDFDAKELRQRMGAVFQEFMAYELSAEENITLAESGDPGVDREAVLDAAKTAGIHEKVSSLPNGYRTLLSRNFFDEQSHGVVLSGGQWQRLARARAFHRSESDLLILDEPSSGLDAEAEARMNAALRLHRKGKTSLLISHRLGSIREADRIIVLLDGVVSEEGSHEELLAADGEYARLFRLQADGYD